MVKLLVEHGADVEAQTSQRKTAMTFAVLNRDVDSEKLLLGAGAFAAHLQPVEIEEDWVDLDALLEAEERGDQVPALNAATDPFAKSPFNSKSKFKFPSEAREAREADLHDSPWLGDKTQAARQAARPSTHN